MCVREVQTRLIERNQLMDDVQKGVGSSGTLIEVRHVRQRYNWDCGIACVLMVLGAEQRAHLQRHLVSVCREEGFGRSTWTIDLCYLLRRYGVPHAYSTVTLGVHPGYRAHSFYSGIVARDAARVNARFAAAAEFGVAVRKARVPLEELLRHLDRARAPVIVLTNARLLACRHCKVNRLSLELRSCLPLWPPPAYQGHYVLLVGHSPAQQRLLYRNPSLHDHLCSCSYQQLDEARTSYGTDEDLVFVSPHSTTVLQHS